MLAGIARLLVLIPADRVPIITPVNHEKTDAENLREDWQRIGLPSGQVIASSAQQPYQLRSQLSR